MSGSLKRCATHLRIAPEGYLGHMEWLEARYKAGMRQRRCPKCELVFYRDEFGPGWAKALRQ